MPAESLYPHIDIPDADLWTFLFERKNKPFADDKGIHPCWYVFGHDRNHIQ